ncbi:MAG: hypothetical protein K8R48_08010 [Alphaproteobacteria bacterium]|nr:hypothetical protein [Alphaproteobacteria bacterium]
MGLFEEKYKPPTVEVSSMITPTAPNQPVQTLYCRIGHGEALFGLRWYAFSETAFALYQGSYVNIALSRLEGPERMNIQALFDNSGQKLIFCPVVNAQPGQRIPCSSLYAMEDDLTGGIKRTFDIPNALRGGAITCAYQQANLKPLTIPTDGGK